MGQFSHHLAKQDACRAFLATQRDSALSNKLAVSASNCQKLLTTSNNPNVASMPMLNKATMDFDFVLYDDGFEFIERNNAVEDLQVTAPNDTHTASLSDLERCNFILFDAPKDDFIINPDTAVFSNNRRVEVILLKIITELEAPLWAFKDIMDWAFDAYQTGYKFFPQHNSYTSQIQTIEKWVGMDHMRPTVININLPGKRLTDSINVTTFDFISQFHSLLSDPLLNTPDNLVLNADNPFAQYIPPDGLLGECISGSWYNNAWAHMEQHKLGDFMIPIILYIDKTCLSLTGRLSIFPVQMSLGILTEQARRRSNAWRPLGYIANEDFFSPKQNEMKTLLMKRMQDFMSNLTLFSHLSKKRSSLTNFARSNSNLATPLKQWTFTCRYSLLLGMLKAVINFPVDFLIAVNPVSGFAEHATFPLRMHPTLTCYALG